MKNTQTLSNKNHKYVLKKINALSPLSELKVG